MNSIFYAHGAKSKNMPNTTEFYLIIDFSARYGHVYGKYTYRTQMAFGVIDNHDIFTRNYDPDSKAWKNWGKISN